MDAGDQIYQVPILFRIWLQLYLGNLRLQNVLSGTYTFFRDLLLPAFLPECKDFWFLYLPVKFIFLFTRINGICKRSKWL